MSRDLPTRALSVRAPWWPAILWLGKDIENRPRRTHMRGRVWLHASRWWREDKLRDLMHHIADDIVRGTPIIPISFSEMQARGGCIVGSVEIVDCVDQSDSPWFFGRYGFVLRNPVALVRPVPCKGALGFFRVPADVLAEIEGQNHG